MAETKPLSEQLVECEQWCAARTEKEYLTVATKGLRVLPEHHAELSTPFPGQEPRANGWLLRSDVIGFGSWLLLSLVLVAGVGTIFVSVFPYVQKTAHPFLYATLLTIPVDGKASPVSPGAVIEYEVPDMYGRPWARIWEKYFEQGMERQEEEDIFSFP